MIFTKDPDATLDYTFDWSEWLQDGESITSHDVDVPEGITLDEVAASATAVTAWLTGGTASGRYSIRCRITTDNTPARIDDRTIEIQILDR